MQDKWSLATKVIHAGHINNSAGHWSRRCAKVPRLFLIMQSKDKIGFLGSKRAISILV